MRYRSNIRNTGFVTFKLSLRGRHSNLGRPNVARAVQIVTKTMKASGPKSETLALERSALHGTPLLVLKWENR